MMIMRLNDEECFARPGEVTYIAISPPLQPVYGLTVSVSSAILERQRQIKFYSSNQSALTNSDSLDVFGVQLLPLSSNCLEAVNNSLTSTAPDMDSNEKAMLLCISSQV